MATNKNMERFATLQLTAPAATTIASGAPLLFGHGSRAMAGVAVEAVATTNPPYDSNSGYIVVDFEGVYNLSVSATTQKSPSAGAAINPGDPVFADAGTFDITSGISFGITLDADSATGTFFGIAMDSIAAGLTATIRVILKNGPVA